MEEEKWQVSWRKSEGPAVADGGRDAPVLTRRRVAQQRNLPLQWWWRKQRWRRRKKRQQMEEEDHPEKVEEKEQGKKVKRTGNGR